MIMTFTGVYKVLVFLLLLGLSSGSMARDNVGCGIRNGIPVTPGYGPFDYTNPSHQESLPIVINIHFTPEVEMLIEGATGTLYADIDYTLRAIPNHHRALYAMSRLQLRDDISEHPNFNYYSAVCYFKRALALQTKDEVVYMLYGIHLHRKGDMTGALDKYARSEALGNSSPEFYYNLSLLYFDMNEITLAKDYASKAYSLGYPLQGLKNKLKLDE